MRKSGRVQSCDYVLVRPLELTVFTPVASQRCSLQVCRSASQQKLQPLPAAPINLTLSTRALPSSLWPLMVAGPAAFPFPLLPGAQAGGTDVLLHQCSNPVCAPPQILPLPPGGLWDLQHWGTWRRGKTMGLQGPVSARHLSLHLWWCWEHLPPSAVMGLSPLPLALAAPLPRGCAGRAPWHWCPPPAVPQCAWGQPPASCLLGSAAESSSAGAQAVSRTCPQPGRARALPSLLEGRPLARLTAAARVGRRAATGPAAAAGIPPRMTALFAFLHACQEWGVPCSWHCQKARSAANVALQALQDPGLGWGGGFCPSTKRSCRFRQGLPGLRARHPAPGASGAVSDAVVSPSCRQFTRV